jgi:hypothetical protein
VVCHFPYGCNLLRVRKQFTQAEYLRREVIRYSLGDLRGARSDLAAVAVEPVTLGI